MQVLDASLSELTPAVIKDCCRLHQLVWPQEGGIEAGLAVWRRAASRRDDGQCSAHRLHYIMGDDAVLAMARSFYRQIALAGERRLVLALAGVCSDPERRGQGLGKAVVTAAFARLDAAVPTALFQTSVPGFYRSLGAVEIAGPIIDSLGGNGFWDPHAMIMPAVADWPQGPVDILGPGW